VPGSGANWIKTWRSREASILPSSKASYALAHFRGKNGESDNSGKLWAAVSLRKRIHRVEQRIACSLEAAIDFETILIQCVKVHAENAPPCFWFIGTLLHQVILCKRGSPELTLV